MRKLFIALLFAFVFVLSSCGNDDDNIGYDNVTYPNETVNEEPAQVGEDLNGAGLIDPPDGRLTLEQEMFLQDLDYLEYVLENNFALFDVAYWARGLDITANIEAIRKMVLENPDIDANEFYNILMFNALSPIIAHTGVISSNLHQSFVYNMDGFWWGGIAPTEAINRMHLDHVMAFYESRHQAAGRVLIEELSIDGLVTWLLEQREGIVAHTLYRFDFLGEQERAEGIRVAIAEGSYEQAATLLYEALDSTENIPNVTTSVIEEGRIARLTVNRFLPTPLWDEEVAYIIEFLQVIHDFEHLIIDLRANDGGLPQHFFESVISPLIRESIVADGFAFFNYDGAYVQEFFDLATKRRQWASHGIDVGFRVLPRPLNEILDEFDLPHFNHDDAHRLSHGFQISANFRPQIERIMGNPAFDGKIWMLTSPVMASAAQIVSWVAKDSGFATLVGDVTGGNYGGARNFVALPNSGIVFQMDVFYVTDSYGRPLEAGTLPHYFNREGMDALETALALIAEGSYRQG